jgi:hypothetical protein
LSIRKRRLANKIAEDFSEYWTKFHLHDQPYDDAMDADIFERYAKVLRKQSKWGYFDFNKNPEGIKRPHFGPSAAGYSDRELYEKARKSKRDRSKFTENQRDWIGLGGAVGGYIQREILLADRHYEKLVGETPKFRMKYDEEGNPMYEHFVKKMHEIEHDGEYFAYFGLPDGVLEYVDDETGEILTVGIEIKSVQQNWSKFKGLTEPKQKHEVQTVAYSDMYGFDFVIIVYVLTYGRDWSEDFSRIKVFGKYIPDADRMALRNRIANAVRQSKSGEAPPLDLRDWKYNDYKTAIAKGISEEELEDLRRQAESAKGSSLPAWLIRNFSEAVDEIEAIRNA